MVQNYAQSCGVSLNALFSDATIIDFSKQANSTPKKTSVVSATESPSVKSQAQKSWDSKNDSQHPSQSPLFVTRCTSLVAEVQPGDLFVALYDIDHDGHLDVTEAVRRGAKTLLVERQVPQFEVPQVLVKDTQQAYANLCQALAGNPAQHLKLIGIAGTNGKTSTASLLQTIFNQAGRPSALASTLGLWDGEFFAPTNGATTAADLPDQLTGWMARAVKNGCQQAFIEINHDRQSQNLLAGLQLAGLCTTNLTYHSGHASAFVQQQTSHLFSQLAADSICILNADDPESAHQIATLQRATITIGIEEPADITAIPVEQYANEQTFLIVAGNDTVAVRTPVIGQQHIYNSLTAAAYSLVAGIDLLTISRGLQAMGGLDWRMQPIRCGQNYPLYLDQASNPHALRETLKAARSVATGRVIAVYDAGRLFESNAIHGDGLAMLSVLEQHSDLPIISGSEMLPTEKQPASDLNKASKTKYLFGLDEAILSALWTAKSEDVVVVFSSENEYSLTNFSEVSIANFIKDVIYTGFKTDIPKC